MGGAACVGGTRVPVWLLASYQRLGWADAAILANCPELGVEDLGAAWSYCVAHPEEIDQAIAEHEASGVGNGNPASPPSYQSINRPVRA